MSSSSSTDHKVKRHRCRYTVVTAILFFAVGVAVSNLIKGAFFGDTGATRFILSTSSSSFPSLNVPLEKWNCAFSKTTTTTSSLLLAATPKSVKFPPISCQDAMAFDRNLKRTDTVSDPNNGRLNGRYTSTNPPFWISLHNAEFDNTRWAIMDFGVYYERLQSEAFVEIITAGTDANNNSKDASFIDGRPLHVVDVGGNIGWFSLQSIAAALSVNRSIVVDVFEPNPRNRLRLCESLHLNQWMNHDKVVVNIYPVGVSSQSGGLVSMSISESGTGKLGVYNNASDQAPEVVIFPLVALDDLADELNWHDDGCDILKVDVEGLEMEVFLGAKRFLANGNVRNIFFEGNTRDETETGKFRNIIQLLLGESGTTYHAYKYGMWMGPSDLVPLGAVTDQLFTLRNNKNHKDMNDAAASTKDQVIRNYTDSLYSLCRGSENKTDQCNFWFRPPSRQSTF